MFLEDLGYAPSYYNEKPVLIFSKYLFEGKEKTALNQKGTLKNVFRRTDKKLLENLFIQINQGKLNWSDKPYKHKSEGRKKEDIVSYNAFMLDFDLKDENDNHYKGEQLEHEKSKLLKNIHKLPIKPDYLIESRNGFHVYYLIQSEERKMSSERWHWIER